MSHIDFRSQNCPRKNFLMSTSDSRSRSSQFPSRIPGIYSQQEFLGFIPINAAPTAAGPTTTTTATMTAAGKVIGGRGDNAEDDEDEELQQQRAWAAA